MTCVGEPSEGCKRVGRRPWKGKCTGLRDQSLDGFSVQGLSCEAVTGPSSSHRGFKNCGRDTGTASREHSMPAESREHVAQGAVFPSSSSDMRLFPGAFLLICRAEGLICEYGDGGAAHWLPTQPQLLASGVARCQDSLGSGSISLAVTHVLTLDKG